jgi:hypothetical protein
MFSFEDLFDQFERELSAEQKYDPTIFADKVSKTNVPKNNLWSSDHKQSNSLQELVSFEPTNFVNHEIVTSDTVLAAHTYFTYFNPTTKNIKCVIRDIQHGETKCMGLLSSDVIYSVIITTADNKSFKISKERPFLNLTFLKDKGFVSS